MVNDKTKKLLDLVNNAKDSEKAILTAIEILTKFAELYKGENEND